MTNAFLYDALFRPAEANATFNAEAHLAAMLRVEAALAEVQSRLGIIPEKAAASIVACAKVESLNIPKLRQDAEHAGNLAIPLVRQLTAAVERRDPEAAGYVHWGATSQDILDTALVVQLKQHLAHVSSQLDRLCVALATLSREYAETVMPGRTWLQQAVPVTFGLKMAGFLDAFLRHRERLSEVRSRVLVVQFGGAAGTLASLGERGLEVATELARELRLGIPAMSWHAQRDRIAEVASFHGVLAGTLGKLGRDISLGMQTEVGEVVEATGQGRGGSSTMPHKRNPVGSAVLLAASTRAPGLVSTLLSAGVQENERGLGGWHAEWETLPELCTLTLGAVERAADMVPSLTVDAEAMRRNLDCTRGMLLAEAVSMSLAGKIGKAPAHALLEQVSHQAIESGTSLLDALQQKPEVTAHLSASDLERLLDPVCYLGSAEAFVARVLASFEAAFERSGEGR